MSCTRLPQIRYASSATTQPQILFYARVAYSPVHTGDKVERTFDIRATKIAHFRQVDRVEHVLLSNSTHLRISRFSVHKAMTFKPYNNRESLIYIYNIYSARSKKSNEPATVDFLQTGDKSAKSTLSQVCTVHLDHATARVASKLKLIITHKLFYLQSSPTYTQHTRSSRWRLSYFVVLCCCEDVAGEACKYVSASAINARGSTVYLARVGRQRSSGQPSGSSCYRRQQTSKPSSI